jgi:hypothetical protein
LKAVAAARAATVNQVHLAAMATALRRLQQERAGEPSGDVAAPHMVVPVDTAAGGEWNGFGNRFGLTRIGLETDLSSPVVALDSAVRKADRRRVDRWKRFWRGVVDGANTTLGRWLILLVAHPDRSGPTVSSLRVPDALVYGGKRFDEVLGVPWLPPGSCCFTVLVSYQGLSTTSVLTHGGTFDPARLADLWRAAVLELHRALVPEAPAVVL